MTERKRYKTTWKVIDENGKVLFESYYGEAEKFLKNCNNKSAKLEPFMKAIDLTTQGQP
jgi:hypothetical protein